MKPDAQPLVSTAPVMERDTSLIEVRDLCMHFPITTGIFSRIQGYTRAVDGTTFDIHRGETLGLVGESGCGKTTVGRCLVRAYRPTSGQILYRNPDGSVVDLARLDGSAIRPYRKAIRMIFQDPYSSLNPRMTVFELISEALVVNRLTQSRSELEDRVALWLHRVGLRPEVMKRYPHAFSGGERQRIVIARALITNPQLVLADEAVSALDVSIRAQILNLLEDLQREFSLTYLFVSHDLSVVRHLCSRVIVMYVGKVVETATGLDLYAEPRHPYTEALLSAIPVSNPRARRAGNRIHLDGEVADPAHPPSGCYFHPRCRYAQEQCRQEAPTLTHLGDGHQVACHFANELQLQGLALA